MAGRKPISDELKASVLDLLQKGEFTSKEIAEMCGISERSVRTIKKEMPDIGDQASQESAAALVRYSKSESKYIKKSMAEQVLFEDSEEGWVYHVTKAYAKTQAAAMWWSGIAYPESASDDWIAKLRMIGVEIAISPLHDKDVWGHDSPEITDDETGELLEDAGSRYRVGDRKKPHWHFLLKFPKRVGFREVNELIRPITQGPYLQKCYSLRGSYEYFIHLNHPDRYQYEKDEIQKYNGFIIEPTRSDQMYMLQDIVETIYEHEFETFFELTEFYINTPEFLLTIKNGSYMLQRILDDIWRKKHPDYVKKIQVVSGNSLIDDSKKG